MTPREDWPATVELLKALWPDWKTNEQMRALWGDHFRHRNQDWLREAVKRVKLTSRWREPKITDIDVAWRAIVLERSERLEPVAEDREAKLAVEIEQSMKRIRADLAGLTRRQRQLARDFNERVAAGLGRVVDGRYNDFYAGMVHAAARRLGYFPHLSEVPT